MLSSVFVFIVLSTDLTAVLAEKAHRQGYFAGVHPPMHVQPTGSKPRIYGQV